MFAYFAAIPGLLNEIKLVAVDTPETARLSILARAQILRQDLRQWYRQYTSSCDGLRSPFLKTGPSIFDNSLYHSVYVFRDVSSASIITTYHAYLIVLNKAIDSLQEGDDYVMENLQLAETICMSVDYCSHSGYCGTQTMRFSLPIAHSILPAKYHGWIEAWISRLSGVLESTRIQSMHS
jgi:hypothetical protein